MDEVRFMTLDPGHFHAGLVHKEMYPQVSNSIDIYAPLGTELLEHLNRIVAFNTRKENPTSWRVELHAGPDFLERMLRDRPGNVVVISGRNQGKIDRIKSCVEAGLNVLSDKPWLIDAADFPKLESALDTAEQKKLVAYDIMTERYEVTSALQRELINDTAVFGTITPGSEKEPAVYMESKHYLFKTVAGMPLRRPAWFFDVRQQGEGITDVGTHLVDLVQWILFPDQAIEYRSDVKVLAGRRWPTVLGKEEFQKMTGEANFPQYLQESVQNEKLNYYCNNSLTYALRGVHCKLDALWHYQALPGTGDTHYAVFKGTRSRLEVRQGEAEKYIPELYVVPNDPAQKQEIMTALQARMQALQGQYAGTAVQDRGAEFHIEIPAKYRVGHEAHFAQVTARFLEYLKTPSSMPAWEKPNMLAKYYTTTFGHQLSQTEAP